MKKAKWLALGVALVLLVSWMLWANQAVSLRRITVADPELPEAFDGFRIAQVSDLHNAQFGQGNRELLALLKQAKPDIIVITGDLIDSRRTDVEIALEFVREAMEIAPCYFATGNHEAAAAGYALLEEGLREAGVILLRSGSVILERDGESLRLVGADDYSFFGPDGDGETKVKRMLEALQPELQPGYNVLLYHRPELAGRLWEMDVDLILSGHAHGGQIRLPWVGGLYAPDQGLFPAYDSGLYDLGDRFLVVSRGLGNSLFPLRINNRPEVILVVLESREIS